MSSVSKETERYQSFPILLEEPLHITLQSGPLDDSDFFELTLPPGTRISLQLVGAYLQVRTQSSEGTIPDGYMPIPPSLEEYTSLQTPTDRQFLHAVGQIAVHESFPKELRRAIEECLEVKHNNGVK